jgi:hypothetical protein
MTGGADRHQIQRDVEYSLADTQRPKYERLPTAQTLARHCLALLTELEQAEKALRRIGELNPEFMAGGKGTWQIRTEKAESRLANMPALVEALERISGLETDDETSDPHGELQAAIRISRAALAAWDNQ